MRRPSSLLLSLSFLPAVVLAGPVVTAPADTPRPVPVQVQSIDLAPTVTPSSAGTAGPRTVATTGERETAPFEALGVTWAPDPEVGPVVVTARTRTHGRWTDWIELDQEVRTGPGETHDSGPGVRAGTEPAWVDDSDGVQVVVRVEAGRAPTDVRLDLIDPGTSTADAGPSAPASIAHAAADRPVIRSRAEWGADESMRGDAPGYSGTVEAVAIHHTASSNDYAPADVPGILRSFYAFHVKSRGWSDLGYNVLVDKFGTAWEGRAGGLDRAVIGAHAGGFNTDTAGISLIGTFDGARLSNEMFETTARVAAWKLSLYHRDPRGRVTLMSRGSTRYSEGTRVDLPRVFGHRDVSQTACPGQEGYAALPALRERISQLIPPAPPPSPFGAVEVAKDERPGLRVGGWATDPDAGGASQVTVSVNGAVAGTYTAADRRPDVWDAHPPYGQHHGFWILVPADPGVHEVCVTAINRNGGADTALGCRTVTVPVPPAPPPTRTSELACPLLEVPPAGFLDTFGSPHARAVDCAVWWKLATGVTSTAYVPAGSVSRAQMASFLARLVVQSGGTLPADPPDAFDDDAGAGLHAKAIDQLAAVGVLRGRAPRIYDPAGLVTRDQMATFLVAAYEYRSGEALPGGEDYFYDDDASPHQANIQKTARAGLTGGVGAGRYGPAEITQRGQMASFLTRVVDLLIEVGETEPHA